MAVDAKTLPDLIVTFHKDAAETIPEPGLKRRVLAYNGKLSLVEHQMTKGWVGKVHSHPHDQGVYIVRGHLTISCKGQSFDVRDGDTFVVRGGVEHGAAAVEDSVVVDVFTPCREDYI